MNNKEEIREILNDFGKNKREIFFIIDFDMKNYYIKPIEEIKSDILFDISGYTNHTKISIDKKITFEKYPIDYLEYMNRFEKVMENIKNGNSYLLNLTTPTKIETNLNLKEIYHLSSSMFKVYKKDEFVCFSPERFVKTDGNKIFTFPMKGTIDAKIANAKNKLLDNQKELAEHTMIVDLLRNDLSMVAKDTKVQEFRFVDKIVSTNKTLLQTSSKIVATLEDDWQKRVGDIITNLLPAGSITGTPKIKTTKIIKEIEEYDRGYFSGICGYFDGYNLDSAVMIRYIENYNGNMIYKSGGGITLHSDSKKEYQEMLDKIYLCL
jgi:para-aminobenzoate synthetase component 1